jgi:hypothetical protein
MRRATSTLAALFILLSAATGFAQYNDVAGQSAPRMKKTIDYREAETGERRTRTVEAKPDTDRYGNASGTNYDLAVDGAFEGQTVAVIHLYTGMGGENFDFEDPKAALKQKGFSVYRWVGAAPKPDELRKKLKKASQLWVIADQNRHLNEEHLKVIKDFFDSGRGVYIWGDNSPYHNDANYLAAALFDSSMEGHYWADKVVHMKLEGKKSGLRRDHLLTTGLEHIYEGVTIAAIEMAGGLEPLIWSSDGNVVTAFYDKGGKRAVLDGGFTRLYNKWDTAGTGRYVKNAAAWLANYERFGDDVVAAKHRK